jgi:hypothetical protein
MPYYGFHVHNSFMAQLYHKSFSPTTCFGLMGPYSGTLGFMQSPFYLLVLSPHCQRLHIGGEWYVCSLFALFSVKYIVYWDVENIKILNCYIKTRVKLSKMSNISVCMLDLGLK